MFSHYFHVLAHNCWVDDVDESAAAASNDFRFFVAQYLFSSSHNIFHTPADNGGDEQKIEGLPCRQQVGPVSLTDCLENVDIGKYWPGFVDGLLRNIDTGLVFMTDHPV